MSQALFDGTLSGEERIEMVARLMGYAGATDAPRDFMERLLSKAEREAQRWLVSEIAECARGEAARRRA